MRGSHNRGCTALCRGVGRCREVDSLVVQPRSPDLLESTGMLPLKILMNVCPETHSGDLCISAIIIQDDSRFGCPQ